MFCVTSANSDCFSVCFWIMSSDSMWAWHHTVLSAIGREANCSSTSIFLACLPPVCLFDNCVMNYSDLGVICMVASEFYFALATAISLLFDCKACTSCVPWHIYTLYRSQLLFIPICTSWVPWHLYSLPVDSHFSSLFVRCRYLDIHTVCIAVTLAS